MKDNKIASAWDKVELNNDAQEKILTNVLEYNDTFCERNENKNRSKFVGIKLVPALSFVFIVLLTCSAIAYATLNSLGRLIFESSNPNSDKKSNFYFEIDADILVPIDEIKGEIRETSLIIAKQCAEYDMFSSQSPNAYSRIFYDVKSAEKYVGYDKLKLSEIESGLKSINVVSVGKDSGELTQIMIWADYSVDSSFSFVSTASIYTTYYSWDVDSGAVIHSEGYEGVELTGGPCVQNGREFYIVKSGESENGWLNEIVYWQEDNVVYRLFTRYKIEKQEEVDKVIEEWMNTF